MIIDGATKISKTSNLLVRQIKLNFINYIQLIKLNYYNQFIESLKLIVSFNRCSYEKKKLI